MRRKKSAVLCPKDTKYEDRKFTVTTFQIGFRQRTFQKPLDLWRDVPKFIHKIRKPTKCMFARAQNTNHGTDIVKHITVVLRC